MTGFNGSWTGTLPAWYIDADPRITVKVINASVAVVSGRIVPAVYAGSRLRVAAVGVSVTFASTTVREIPKTRLTQTAGSRVGVRVATAAACFYVAEVIEGSDTVAVAWLATFRSEVVRPWCTSVAFTTDYLRLARTPAAELITQETVRSGRVALTG